MSARRLDIGLSEALHVRHERLSARHDACRLMYVSDIHLRPGRSTLLTRQIIECAEAERPDGILLGGDLVDRASELPSLSVLVRSLSEVAPLLAIGGNHDSNVGLGRVQSAVVDAGGMWIHESAGELLHGGRKILISGPEATAKSQNTNDALGKIDVRILCAHNPRVWKTARGQGLDLVLAGHLHGCQFVAFKFRDRLFPGALFYPYCYLTHQCGPTRLVVSRGVSDLFPIRWRCPREVVVCYV